ncbi:hypothetical protein [Halomonas sp. DQ26W]|uniref:hypothetical protein n=1 Tax=Halomonas sp. DQ26W TaxID=2282311 RepID=UPI0011C04C98|nr:hypothetical protein [Halomonas sp. DQ26W]
MKVPNSAMATEPNALTVDLATKPRKLLILQVVLNQRNCSGRHSVQSGKTKLEQLIQGDAASHPGLILLLYKIIINANSWPIPVTDCISQWLKQNRLVSLLFVPRYRFCDSPKRRQHRGRRCVGPELKLPPTMFFYYVVGGRVALWRSGFLVPATTFPLSPSNILLIRQV